MLEVISHFIISFIQSTSYFGIFLLMCIESVLIPIPSEITMPFSGFLASQGILNFWLVVITGTVANLVGSLIAYCIGYFLEETVLLRLIKKYGKFILVTEREYRHAEHWFQKYGDKIIFVSRLLPAVRTVISLPAGVFRMNMKKFVIYTFVGCFIWSIFLTYLGYVMGENWQALDPYYRKFEYVILGLIVFGGIFYVVRKLRKG